MNSTLCFRDKKEIGRIGICTLAALASGSAFFFLLRYFAENYLRRPTGFLPDEGLIARALFAGIPAAVLGSLVGYLLFRILKGAAENRSLVAHLFLFGGLFDCGATVLALRFSGVRGLVAKVIGCAAAAIFILISLLIVCLENRKKSTGETEEAPKKRSFVSRFLFSAQKKPFLFKTPYLCALVRSLSVAIVALFPIFCQFLMEYANYIGLAGGKRSLFDLLNGYYHDRLVPALFSLLILYLFYAVFILVFKKAWAATLVLYLLSGGMAVTNYLKYSLTGQFFFPWDLIEQAGNTGELLSFVKIGLPAAMYLMLAFGALCVVLLVFSRVSVPVRWPIRIVGTAALVLCIVLPVNTEKKVEQVLTDHDLRIFDTALQESNYEANGFVAGFTVNVLSLNIDEPEGYSRDAIEQILKDYPPKDADESFNSPDVILILSESFWDPQNLPNTVFSESLTDHYREITARENTVSGSLYVSPIGGGTIYTEYEILTGLSSAVVPSGSIPWQYVTRTTPSFVSAFHDMGYRTLAIHPYLASFYNRKDSYPLIGFDRTIFAEELEENRNVDILWRGRQISDETFVDYLKYYMEDDADADGRPVFVFGISMENHQPYERKFINDAVSLTVENPAFSENSIDVVTNFAQGVQDADKALGKLVDFIDARERDTILIYFGDHLPTLGANYAAYLESGYVDATYTTEGRVALRNTPFLIYANYELGDSELLHAGADNEIPSYGLLTGAMQLMGAPLSTPAVFVNEYIKTIPYYHSVYKLPTTKEQESMIDLHKLLSYDVLGGSRYSVED